MEIARVDIRKLQLLNDRINQCLDALNQVRFSVHGLASGGAGAAQQFAQSAAPQLGVDPRFAYPGAGQPGTQVPSSGYSGGFGFSPYSGSPGMGLGSFPGTISQMPIWGVGGSVHGGFENEGLHGHAPQQDPSLAWRLRETFPYAGLAYPPNVNIA